MCVALASFPMGVALASFPMCVALASFPTLGGLWEWTAAAPAGPFGD
jgi:hypothetical protein